MQEAGLRPEEAGGGPSRGSDGFSGVRRLLERPANLGDFLQRKSEAGVVLGAVVVQGGCWVSFPVVRRSSGS